MLLSLSYNFMPPKAMLNDKAEPKARDVFSTYRSIIMYNHLSLSQLRALANYSNLLYTIDLLILALVFYEYGTIHISFCWSISSRFILFELEHYQLKRRPNINV